MAVDTIHTQTVEHIERPHPFGVTLCQIVVHGYHMNTVSGQCVQEYREGSYQCLTFTGCHFRNLAFMENDTTKQLYVVVNHVPHHVVTTGYPVILINGFVSLDAYKILCCSELAVEFRGSHYNFFIFGKTFGSCLNDGESNGQYFVQCFFIFLQNFFFYLVYLRKYFFAVFQFKAFDTRFQFFHFRTFSGC